LERIFEPYLGGNSLINQKAHFGKTPWLNFQHISNKNWYHDSIVLMGDAAHTTHFTIGSGTKLALEDAIWLAENLYRHQNLRVALEAYEVERRAAVLTLQSAACNSARWFENVRQYICQDAMQFAYSLLHRRTQRKDAPVELSWFHRLKLALGEISTLIPAGESFVLVDEDNWEIHVGDSRRAIPFLERDGRYWGPPPDDETAIRELERLRQTEAPSFIVFGWPAFWWLEYYTEFQRYLRSRFKCLLENERVVLFELHRELDNFSVNE
jgi:hypothetical protein